MSGLFIRLGMAGTSLLVLLTAGILFIGGSAGVDAVAIRAPLKGRVAETILTQVPAVFRRFAVMGLSYSPTEPSADGTRRAEVTLALREPLFAPKDFVSVAIERGDDPAAFAAALDRRQKLPKDTAPRIPELTVPREVYVVAEPAGRTFKLKVEFQAIKGERLWSLAACYLVWSGQRTWLISDLSWGTEPAEFGEERTRGAIGSAAVFAGEESGEALLQRYVRERRAFIDAVGDREWQVIERAADAAIRAEIAPGLTPSGAFAIASTKLLRPSLSPSAGGTSLRLESNVVIEQTVELFRAAGAELLTLGQRAQVATYEGARRSVAEFQLTVGPTPAITPVYYASVSPVRTRWTGKVQFQALGSADRPTVAGVEWVQKPDLPAAVVTVADAGENAVFQTADAKLRSVSAYTAEIESYKARVRDAIAQLERRWGSDREVWRLLARAIAVGGGPELFGRESGCNQLVSGTRRAPDGREFAFQGVRHTFGRFRWREDYSFTGEKVNFTQAEALDGSGLWRVFNGKMRPEDLFSPEQVADQRRMDHARNVLAHLVSDESRHYQIERNEKDKRSALTLSSADFPSLTLMFDAATGALASVSYLETGKVPRMVEWRFADFRDFGGAVQASRVTLLLDGKVSEDLTVQSSQRVETLNAAGGATFRNPYSPRKAFRGNANAPLHALRITNSNAVGGSVLVCIDDDPATIALGARASRVVMLPDGEHELMIVGWNPQINVTNLKEPYRIEAKPMRFSIYYDQELTIGADKLLGGSLRWNLK